MTDFTSEELAKRLYTNDSPESWAPGKVVKTTGTGLGVEASEDIFVKVMQVGAFSDINVTGVTEPRLYVVATDETNANQRTQYLFDGSALMWLVALEA